LFQQKLEIPKRSHELLAELLGAPELVQTQADPRPEDFSRTLITTVTQSWVDFNLAYSSTANSKFDKYAKRLGEEPRVENARPPDAILAPYLISIGEGDAWWELSKQLFDGTVRAGGDTANCVRVIAASSPVTLEAHALSVPDANLVIWVSGLDEMRSGALELAQYAKAIRRMSAANKRSFALYGGFFAVILQNLGLGGASHGIGFGEYRDWVELPQSGMPPARYYVPQIHRYLQPDEATQLMLANPRLVACDCPECGGSAPNTLEYHSLMKHSVYCRSKEIEGWADLGIDSARVRLQEETTEWRAILSETRLPSVVTSAALIKSAHLMTWIEALSSL
jgi:hypothetical protein